MPSTHVNVELDAKANKALELSAKNNKRSKRQEASVILEHALNNFNGIGLKLKGKNKENAHN